MKESVGMLVYQGLKTAIEGDRENCAKKYPFSISLVLITKDTGEISTPRPIFFFF